MNKDLSLSKTIVIRGDPEKVWDTLTNPEKNIQLFSGTKILTDWKVGSPIIFQGEFQDRKYEDRGNVLEIQMGKVIKYNYWTGFSGLEDEPENYSLRRRERRMQNYPERTDLGNGFSWTAQYKSWDYAHYGRFYFLMDIYQGDEIVKQLKVYVDDRAYGDSSCKLTDAEIGEEIRSELHSLALCGESNTDSV